MRHWAYLLKEQLRAVFAAKGERVRILLAGWLAWARRSRLASFVRLAKSNGRYRPLIWNTLDHELSNARVDQHPPAGADPPRLRLPQPRVR